MLNKIFGHKILKKLPLEKMIYPAISLALAIIIFILFIKSLLFLSGNINKAFSNNFLNEKVLVVDKENYDIIRKRFGWPELQEAASTPAAAPAAGPAEASPAAAAISEGAAVASTTKASITIRVLNSTETNGLAKILKTGLAKAGYLNIKVGNLSPAISTTTIQAKTLIASQPALMDEVRQIVAEKYLPRTGADLPDGADDDILITIGNN
jgi:hypothetical protein